MDNYIDLDADDKPNDVVSIPIEDLTKEDTII